MIQNIKKEFFALRNGVIADTLRKAGLQYKVIFGLQVPQIAQIARSISDSAADSTAVAAVATQLWNDREVRESRLLACYLFSSQTLGMEKALELCGDLQTKEEADMLAFRLLKRLDFAPTLLSRLKERPTPQNVMAYNSLNKHLE